MVMILTRHLLYTLCLIVISSNWSLERAYKEPSLENILSVSDDSIVAQMTHEVREDNDQDDLLDLLDNIPALVASCLAFLFP